MYATPNTNTRNEEHAMTVAAFDKQWAELEAAHAAIQEEIEEIGARNVSSASLSVLDEIRHALHAKLEARSQKIRERMDALRDGQAD